jgi:hypothetical protein
MTHESVVTLLEDVAKAVGDNQFGYGAFEDFNSITNKSFPFLWLHPLEGEFVSSDSKVTSSIDFEVRIDFLALDSVTGTEFETAQAWDKCFQLAEAFIHKLDEFRLTSEIGDLNSDLVHLDRIRFKEGRKATGDALSGIQLTFTMTVPTQFEYCSIYE